MCLAHGEKRLKGARERLLVDTEAAPPLERTEMMAGQVVRQITTREYAADEEATGPTRLPSHLSPPCVGPADTAETEAAEEAQHLARSVFGTLSFQTAVYRE